jgi:hypothetical protein
MALATLGAISGPKKVSISGPTPSNAPRYGLLLHPPNPYVLPHINNRYEYIKSKIYLMPSVRSKEKSSRKKVGMIRLLT